MKKYLLPNGGKFYKANLHCHSNISDGDLSPLELKELYKSNGYSVLAYTDHDVFIPHHDLTDNEFLALAGFEQQYNENGVYPSLKDMATTHICFIAKSPDNDVHPDWNEKYAYVGNSKQYWDKVKYDKSQPKPERNRSAKTVCESIKKARDAGFFVTYNHPTWSLDRYNDYINYDGINAMEIYNNDCNIIGYNSYVPDIYDDFLKLGKKIFAIASDDNHNKYPITDPRFDSFGGFVMIKANCLDYSSIINALCNGDFYASQGPEIYELYIENSKIFIKCSNAERVKLNTNRRSAQIVHAPKGSEICSAEFNLDENDEYFRLTVIDKYGKCANTNAYFVKDVIKEK